MTTTTLKTQTMRIYARCTIVTDLVVAGYDLADLQETAHQRADELLANGNMCGWDLTAEYEIFDIEPVDEPC